MTRNTFSKCLRTFICILVESRNNFLYYGLWLKSSNYFLFLMLDQTILKGLTSVIECFLGRDVVMLPVSESTDPWRKNEVPKYSDNENLRPVDVGLVAISLSVESIEIVRVRAGNLSWLNVFLEILRLERSI